MEDKTLTDKVEQYAREGKSLREIVEATGATKGTVHSCMHRLRKNKDFDVTFVQVEGRERTHAIKDMFYRFSGLHGFFPSKAEVGELFGVSRERARQICPKLAEQAGEFVSVATRSLEFDKNFLSFVERYMEKYNLSQKQAIKSITYNLDFDGLLVEEEK